MKSNFFCFFSLMIVLVFCCSGFCEAGVWIDDFEDGKPNGWTPFSSLPMTVKCRNGVLEFRVLPNPHPLSIHLLEWTAISFEADSLTVMATFPVQNDNYFGISLGKHILGFGPLIECYDFLRENRVSGVGITSAWRGGASGRKGKNPHGKLGETIKHIRIVFNFSRFQMFSEDNLMADFEDEDFLTIDAIGIFARTSENEEARGKIDDFIVSGPSIPNGNGNWEVKPSGKLATTWGKIKSQHLR